MDLESWFKHHKLLHVVGLSTVLVATGNLLVEATKWSDVQTAIEKNSEDSHNLYAKEEVLQEIQVSSLSIALRNSTGSSHLFYSHWGNQEVRNLWAEQLRRQSVFFSMIAQVLAQTSYYSEKEQKGFREIHSELTSLIVELLQKSAPPAAERLNENTGDLSIAPPPKVLGRNDNLNLTLSNSLGPISLVENNDRGGSRFSLEEDHGGPLIPLGFDSSETVPRSRIRTSRISMKMIGTVGAYIPMQPLNISEAAVPGNLRDALDQRFRWANERFTRTLNMGLERVFYERNSSKSRYASYFFIGAALSIASAFVEWLLVAIKTDSAIKAAHALRSWVVSLQSDYISPSPPKQFEDLLVDDKRDKEDLY